MTEQPKGFEGEPKSPSREKNREIQPTIEELEAELSSLDNEVDVAETRLNNAKKEFEDTRRDVDRKKTEIYKQIERLKAIETLKKQFVHYVGDGIDGLRKGEETGAGYWFKKKGFAPDFFINEVGTEAWHISTTLSGDSYSKLIGYEEVKKLWDQVVQDKNFTAKELKELVDK